MFFFYLELIILFLFINNKIKEFEVKYICNINI